MRKGMVVLVSFPFTDLSEQKVRPALVLHVSRGENCIVAFVTSSMGRKSYPFDVRVSASPESGLKVDSLIKLDHLATLQKKTVLGELGVLPSHSQKEVNLKLKTLFNIS